MAVSGRARAGTSPSRHALPADAPLDRGQVGRLTSGGQGSGRMGSACEAFSSGRARWRAARRSAAPAGEGNEPACHVRWEASLIAASLSQRRERLFGTVGGLAAIVGREGKGGSSLAGRGVGSLATASSVVASDRVTQVVTAQPLFSPSRPRRDRLAACRSSEASGGEASVDAGLQSVGRQKPHARGLQGKRDGRS